jgi:hypothetical protein
MRKLLILISLLLITEVISAQFRKYSNDYLNIGVGGRSFAMGRAVIASYDGVYSAYWNPALLTRMNTDMDVALMHSEYFAGVSKYDYLATAYRIDSTSVLSGSLIRFAVDDIPGTINLIDKDGNINYDNIEKFSVADYALFISYAKQSRIKGLSYGGNVKILYRSVGKYANAWGMGFDLGVYYRHRGWNFAAVLRDATSTFTAWSFSKKNLEIVTTDGTIINSAPDNSFEWMAPRLVLGAGKRFKVYRKFSALAELDVEMTFDGKSNQLISSDFISLEPQLGLEIDYNRLFYLRLGLNNLQNQVGFNKREYVDYQVNFGVGVEYMKFKLDYALTDWTDTKDNLYSHIFSLRYSFNL